MVGYYALSSGAITVAASVGRFRRNMPDPIPVAVLGRLALHGRHVHGDAGERIDPVTEPARIRPYFVDPDFARRGVGSTILKACESAARAADFTKAVLGATRTGLPCYARHGYVDGEREEVPLPSGGWLTVLHMSRPLV